MWRLMQEMLRGVISLCPYLMWTMEVPGAWKISVSVYIRIGSGFLTLISFGTRISIGAAKSCLNEYPPLCHAYTPRIFQKMGSSFRMGVKRLYSSVFVGWRIEDHLSVSCQTAACVRPAVSGEIVWRRTENQSQANEKSFGAEKNTSWGRTFPIVL